jgi:hypothetical protein
VGLIVGFSLDQFSEILKVRDAAGKPYLLIGGQAVNYWAERYLASESELVALRPFTSADIDFKGNVGDVRRIAEQLALKPGYPPKVAMTALAGVIPLQIAGQPSNIEIVRQVPGVSSTVDKLAIEAKWEDNNIRVLDPVSLLASKLELVATVPQAKRNDVPHLKILVPCVRAFLDELLRRVEHKEIPARSWLLTANQALKLTTDHRAQKIGNKYQIYWSGILPLASIGKSLNERIKRFREQQLEHGYKKSKRITI